MILLWRMLCSSRDRCLLLMLSRSPSLRLPPLSLSPLQIVNWRMEERGLSASVNFPKRQQNRQSLIKLPPMIISQSPLNQAIYLRRSHAGQWIRIVARVVVPWSDVFIHRLWRSNGGHFRSGDFRGLWGRLWAVIFRDLENLLPCVWSRAIPSFIALVAAGP